MLRLFVFRHGYWFANRSEHTAYRKIWLLLLVAGIATLFAKRLKLTVFTNTDFNTVLKNLSQYLFQVPLSDLLQHANMIPSAFRKLEGVLAIHNLSDTTVSCSLFPSAKIFETAVMYPAGSRGYVTFPEALVSVCFVSVCNGA